MVIEETEPTDLPKCYLVGMPADYIPNVDFGVPIPDHEPIIQVDPASGDCNN